MSLQGLVGGASERSGVSPAAPTLVFFGSLHAPLKRFIADSEILVGCVAWLTDQGIVSLLAERPVALVVQKENWWKKKTGHGAALVRRYASLTGGIETAWLGDGWTGPSVRLAPIACVGHANRTKTTPLMHHKFLVRCSLSEEGLLVPHAVWTGSFNFTGSAAGSLENAVEIHDPAVAAAYLAEFALVAAASESMNWTRSEPKPKPGAVFVPPPAATATRTVSRGRSAGARSTSKKAASKRPAARASTGQKTAPQKATPPKATSAKAAAKSPTPIRSGTRAAAKKAPSRAARPSAA